ncbi:MAG: hypothetical protein ACK40S_12020 [Burkholderiaceae bacterium]
MTAGAAHLGAAGAVRIGYLRGMQTERPAVTAGGALHVLDAQWQRLGDVLIFDPRNLSDLGRRKRK